MSVKLDVDGRFWGTYSGKAKIYEVEARTVGECLKKLVEIEPTIKNSIFTDSGEPTGVVFISINQAPLIMRAMDKEVKDGDLVGVIFGSGS